MRGVSLRAAPRSVKKEELERRARRQRRARAFTLNRSKSCQRYIFRTKAERLNTTHSWRVYRENRRESFLAIVIAVTTVVFKRSFELFSISTTKSRSLCISQIGDFSTSSQTSFLDSLFYRKRATLELLENVQSSVNCDFPAGIGSDAASMKVGVVI